jgi:hypothetical protein
VSGVPRVRLRDVQLFERPVTLRLPFRFGAATVTHCPQAFVRVEAEVDGRPAVGATAELMVPKWFDKSPQLTQAQNFDQLRQSLRLAREAYLDAGAAASAHALHRAAAGASVAQAIALGLPRLAAQFGPAELDKALADAVLRAGGQSWCDGLAAGALGDPWSKRLTVLRPRRVALRHTVGLADRLRDTDPGTDPGDGLPATLEAAIAAYGLRRFKLKLAGELQADLDRLQAIADLLDTQAGDYRVTLDGNETFGDAAALGRCWAALSARPGLQRLLQRTLLLEQPLPRARALDEPIAALGIGVPVIIDESDDDDGAFDRALTLGYRGVSSKACKGLYRSLQHAAMIAARPAEHLLLSGEDLTCQAGLAVQQDTLLAASLGVAHIERNGHHYVDGFGVAPAAESTAFGQAHAGFYARNAAGTSPRLRVHDGELDLSSLHGPGFASAVHPMWDHLHPLG